MQALPGASTAPDNREGIRVNFDAQHGNGWLLLRLSLHDPLMPLNFESDSPGGVKVIAKTVYSLLQQEAGVLDLSPLATGCGISRAGTHRRRTREGHAAFHAAG